jgi:hypothetical protein
MRKSGRLATWKFDLVLGQLRRDRQMVYITNVAEFYKWQSERERLDKILTRPRGSTRLSNRCNKGGKYSRCHHLVKSLKLVCCYSTLGVVGGWRIRCLCFFQLAEGEVVGVDTASRTAKAVVVDFIEPHDHVVFDTAGVDRGDRPSISIPV